VFAAQRIFRLAVVIKGHGLPVLLDVTAFTLVAEASFVALGFVILAMAGHALGRSFLLVQETGMAGRAFGEQVFAAQRVFGVAVVVEPDVLPIAISVASLALVAELALVLWQLLHCTSRCLPVSGNLVLL
jgi:hypothetical protein